MDCSNGQIHEFKITEEKDRIFREFEVQGKRLLELTQEEAIELKPMSRKMRKGTMRNKPCRCGSGVKFKKCCWSKYA